LADRIKIKRKAAWPDINLSIQFLLNCQMGGSCNGGDHLATYRAIEEYGSIPFEDCMIYQACSSDSKEAGCSDKKMFECTATNICKTCDTFTSNGGACTPIKYYPNATILSYGAVKGSANMMAEIYKNGPIACGINAEEITDYVGGQFMGKLLGRIGIYAIGFRRRPIGNRKELRIRHARKLDNAQRAML